MAEFAKWWEGFRASGNIAPIALGISREELLAFLGEPDDEARGILKYGRLEFHFGDGLSLIYADDDFGVVETCTRPLLTSQSDCRWFAVQCILQHPKVTTDFLYEERITIWRTAKFEDAIAQAEAEASSYAGPGKHLGYSNAFEMYQAPTHGEEVYSLMRESTLPPEEYLSSFHDTGKERSQRINTV